MLWIQMGYTTFTCPRKWALMYLKHMAYLFIFILFMSVLQVESHSWTIHV